MTTNEIMMAARVAKAMIKYNLDDEAMEAILDLHDGNVNAALRTIEAVAKTIKAGKEN